MTLNYEWQWMGQQWERSLFCQFQLLGSYWEVHWLKLAPGLKKVTWGKTTPRNIFFRPILPNFDNGIEVGDDDFGGCSMLPVCKTMVVFWRGEGSTSLCKSRIRPILIQSGLSLKNVLGEVATLARWSGSARRSWTLKVWLSSPMEARWFYKKPIFPSPITSTTILMLFGSPFILKACY